MDCVGCDKCRLWGKVQTTGLATALKVLFELDEMALKSAARLLGSLVSIWLIDYFSPQANHDLLHRSEVVALINTLFRFSESLKAVDDFRRIWRSLDSSDTRTIVTETDKITTHPDVSSDIFSSLFTFSYCFLASQKFRHWLLVTKITRETFSIQHTRIR